MQEPLTATGNRVNRRLGPKRGAETKSLKHNSLTILLLILLLLLLPLLLRDTTRYRETKTFHPRYVVVLSVDMS